MKARPAVVTVCALLVLAAGCSAASRHKTLSFFFDGVPPAKTADSTGSTDASGTSPGAKPAAAGYSKHMPYAEKQCSACHVAANTNTVVAQGEKLCLQCHDVKLDSPSVHGAIAAGGCVGCHDPHASKYPHLLAAEGDAVCLQCHDNTTLEMGEQHHGRQATCVTCHDPHVSDKKNLLK